MSADTLSLEVENYLYACGLYETLEVFRREYPTKVERLSGEEFYKNGKSNLISRYKNIESEILETRKRIDTALEKLTLSVKRLHRLNAKVLRLKEACFRHILFNLEFVNTMKTKMFNPCFADLESFEKSLADLKAAANSKNQGFVSDLENVHENLMKSFTRSCCTDDENISTVRNEKLNEFPNSVTPSLISRADSPCKAVDNNIQILSDFQIIPEKDLKNSYPIVSDISLENNATNESVQITKECNSPCSRDFVDSLPNIQILSERELKNAHPLTSASLLASCSNGEYTKIALMKNNNVRFERSPESINCPHTSRASDEFDTVLDNIYNSENMFYDQDMCGETFSSHFGAGQDNSVNSLKIGKGLELRKWCKRFLEAPDAFEQQTLQKVSKSHDNKSFDIESLCSELVSSPQESVNGTSCVETDSTDRTIGYSMPSSTDVASIEDCATIKDIADTASFCRKHEIKFLGQDHFRHLRERCHQDSFVVDNSKNYANNGIPSPKCIIESFHKREANSSKHTQEKLFSDTYLPQAKVAAKICTKLDLSTPFKKSYAKERERYICNHNQEQVPKCDLSPQIQNGSRFEIHGEKETQFPDEDFRSWKKELHLSDGARDTILKEADPHEGNGLNSYSGQSEESNSVNSFKGLSSNSWDKNNVLGQETSHHAVSDHLDKLDDVITLDSFPYSKFKRGLKIDLSSSVIDIRTLENGERFSKDIADSLNSRFIHHSNWGQQGTNHSIERHDSKDRDCISERNVPNNIPQRMGKGSDNSHAFVIDILDKRLPMKCDSSECDESSAGYARTQMLQRRFLDSRSYYHDNRSSSEASRLVFSCRDAFSESALGRMKNNRECFCECSKGETGRDVGANSEESLVSDVLGFQNVSKRKIRRLRSIYNKK